MASTSPYVYIATSAPASGVTAAIVCSLSHTPGDTHTHTRNLVIAKTNRLEIHEITDTGLQPIVETQVYGRIATLRPLRLQGSDTDVIVVTTERYQFAALRLDTHTKSITTIACGDMRGMRGVASVRVLSFSIRCYWDGGLIEDRIGRPVSMGQRCDVDPLGRAVAALFYEGVLKVIPAGASFDSAAFNLRLEETDVLDFVFLHPRERAAGASAPGAPVLAVLYGDYVPGSAPAAVPQRHIRTYELDVKSRSLRDGPWRAQHISSGVTMLVPVAGPNGGVLAVGHDGVTYYNGTVVESVTTAAPMLPRAWTAIDANQLLVADAMGGLHHLTINRAADGAVDKLVLQRLGDIVLPSAVAHLANGVAFVGSMHGDSQLVRYSPGAARGSAPSFSVQQTFTNIGPVVDMCVMDLDRQGQGQVVTASGAFKEGSLRVIRNGVGVEQQAVVDMPGIRGMWSLRASDAAKDDNLLVLSFATETRAFLIAGAELDETDAVPGFSLDSSTLLSRNMRGNHAVQVTPTAVKLVRLGSEGISNAALVATWTPAALDATARRITLAAANDTQIIIALSGGMVAYLSMDPAAGALSLTASRAMPHEVACVNINPLNDGAATTGGGDAMDTDDDASIAQFAAIGLWTDLSVRMLALREGLPDVAVEMLGGEVQPRSILLTRMEGIAYLFAALGDGHVVNFRVNVSDARRAATGAADVSVLNDRKQVAVGTQPVTLSTFVNKGKLNVFAACDRPTVIFSSSSKLLYSNVNIQAVTFMAPFSSAAFPDCLALASDADMTIGTVDDIQKLHVRTVPLGVAPRRIAHHKAAHTVVVAVEASQPDVTGELVETASLRTFDDVTFDALHTFDLDPHEVTQSLVVTRLGDDTTDYVLAGTAYMLEDEEEPSRGRLIVLAIVGEHADRRFHLVSSRDVRGGVLALATVGNKLAAGINGKVSIFGWGVPPKPVSRARAAGATASAAAAPAPADTASASLETDAEVVPRQLYHECSFAMNTLVLYLDARGDFILVGDLMKSISLLRYNVAENTLEEVAADPGMNWMTAVAMLDDTAFIGAEHHYNLFTATRNLSATSEEARSRLQVVGEFHLGDMVNRFRPGSLVMLPAEEDAGASRAPSHVAGDEDEIGMSESTSAGAAAKKRPRRADEAADTAGARGAVAAGHSAPRPRFVFGTVGGALGVVISLPPTLYRYLVRVQKAASMALPSIGALSHSHWRSWYSDRRLPNITPVGGEDAQPTGFVDGDLIEQVLDAPRGLQEKVVSLLNQLRDAGDADAVMHPDGSTTGDASLEEVLKTIEDLSRLH